MKKPAAPKKTARKRYSDEYRAEALKLAENVGVAAAARQLGLHEPRLYGWRSKASLRQNDSEQQQACWQKTPGSNASSVSKLRSWQS